MNQPASSQPSGTREDIVAILLGAAAVATLAGVAAYAAGRRASVRPALPPHAVVAEIPLKEIAQRVDVQPPTALVHLNKLQEEGRVRRLETKEGPRYAVLPFLRCDWTDPDHGIRTTWQSSRPVDWRFPLVSRVPDAAAQEFLVEWLDRALARGLLPGPGSILEPGDETPPMCEVLVYGSCARGDAHPRSDVDLLVYGSLPKKAREALKSLAHEVGLKASRAPDVRFADAKGWEESDPGFKDSLRRDGRTVFTNQPEWALEGRLARSRDA